MKLHSFFLVILSFICTLSVAAPVRNQCQPVNADDAALRNSNGAGLSLFSNQVRINIDQAYVAPSSWNPHGGFTVNVINDYCLSISILFEFPHGGNFRQTVPARTHMSGLLIPHAVGQGGNMQVSVTDFL